MFQSHHERAVRPASTPGAATPQHLAILDGLARELTPSVWALGAQCSILRLPADLTDRERRFVEGVERHVGRIARVLASVHDLVLAETGGELPLDPRPADVAAVCDDAADLLRANGIADEIGCEGEGDGQGVFDPEWLCEAISYLLECAQHAAPEDGRVHLRWRGGPEEIVLAVERPPRPDEARSGIDLEFGARLGAGPEETVKAAVARRVILQHGGTLARFGTSRAVAYVALLPRRPA